MNVLKYILQLLVYICNKIDLIICVFLLGQAGYLACARCSNTGALVLIEPISTVNGGDRPLSPPRTERCTNCAGSGKVRFL